MRRLHASIWHLTHRLGCGSVVAFTVCTGLARDPGIPTGSTVSMLERNAVFWQDKGRPDLARQLWRKILRIEPQHPRALAALGLSSDAALTPRSPRPKQAHPRSSPVAPAKRLPPLPATTMSTANAPFAAATSPGADTEAAASEALRVRIDAVGLADSVASIPPGWKSWELSTLRIHKPGTAGISALDWNSQSLRGTWLTSKDEHWQLQIDRIVIHAGQNTLSGLQAEGPLGSTDIAPPLGLQPYKAQAQGWAIAAGHESPRWRWDVGSTPSGFERARLTGGVQWTLRESDQQWRLRASARPVTSSLLSFAGQVDPITRQRWGAVDRQAVEGDMRLDNEPNMGWRVQGRWARYEGQQVLSNRERWLQVGTVFPVIDTPQQQTDHGPIVEGQQFDNNQNHYSLGHGGYYSPQSRQSLGWLLNHGEVHPQWMWRTRMSLSHSRVRTDAAAIMPLSNTGSYYAATRSASWGGSAQLSAEHRLGPGWVIGSSLMLERAPDYQFNAWMIYLRWTDQPLGTSLSVWPSRIFPGLAP